MMPLYSGQLAPERGNRHMTAAMVACALSIGCHLLFMYWAADWRLDIARVLRPAAETDRDRPPLRVERLDRDPLDAFGRPERGAVEPGADSGAPLDRVRDLARLPDSALLTPPALTREALAGTLVSLQAPARPPAAITWQPRQQILAVVDRRANDELATLPRREIPAVERVAHAPDYVPAVDVARDRFGSSERLVPSGGTSEQAAVAGAAGRRQLPAAATTLPAEAAPAAAETRFGEDPASVSDRRELDDRLKAAVSVYRPRNEPDRLYFRVSIDRRAAAELPVAPKDLLLVQDCSSSLAEERLRFCRESFTAALGLLGPADRFNVVGFSDRVERLFPDWADVTPANTNAAARFIGAMRASGDTDVFASMRALFELPRDPRRPVIALVVTDGRATVGLTESSRIIGEFSRLNDGQVSIFTLGTHGRANAYLLDMLAYCNRGESTVVTSGRWDIPDAIADMAASVRRPVLADVRFDADRASQSAIYPRLASNLYADRPLELYGRCPAGTETLVLQVRGRAGDADCDVVFQLRLDDAAAGEPALRDQWARQRMYDLVGAYARSPREHLLAEMYRLSREYDLPIPYRRQL